MSLEASQAPGRVPTASRRGMPLLLSRRLAGAPPASFFVGSAVFHYLGPAFAVLLFALVDPLGTAWLRIATAAALFAAWRKPWRTVGGLDRETRQLLLGLGDRPGGDEQLLLHRDRPASAGNGRGDRVPAGHPPRGSRCALGQERGCRGTGGARRLPADGRPARGCAVRRGLRLRERGALCGLHRARSSPCAAARRSGGSTVSPLPW